MDLLINYIDKMAHRFPITTDNERTKRAINEEQEAFIRLYIEQKFSWELIARTEKLLASEDVPYKSFGKIHLAALRYQAAGEAVQTAVLEDAALANQEPQYKKKLKEQMIEVDSLLTQLREAMNMFSLPTKSSDGPNAYLCKARAQHLEGQINQQIRKTKALITTKFDLVKANNINLCIPMLYLRLQCPYVFSMKSSDS